MKILLATTNIGKVRELERLLEGTDFEVVTNADFPGAPDVAETGKTFEENARLKSNAMAKFTNLIAIADDSGLCVDHLNGEPGVRSARYAGDHNPALNNAKLLSNLGGVTDRQAHFETAIVVTDPKSGDELVVTGQCHGQILKYPKGKDGFGYDPLFMPDGYDRTFAEMTMDEKNEISHRGKAFRELIKKLPEWTKRHA